MTPDRPLGNNRDKPRIAPHCISTHAALQRDGVHTSKAEQYASANGEQGLAGAHETRKQQPQTSTATKLTAFPRLHRKANGAFRRNMDIYVRISATDTAGPSRIPLNTGSHQRCAKVFPTSMLRRAVSVARAGVRGVATSPAPSITLPNLGALIGNKWVDASDKFATANPATEHHIAHVVNSREAEVEAAYQAANKAFYGGEYSKMSGYERGVMLNRWGNLRW